MKRYRISALLLALLLTLSPARAAGAPALEIFETPSGVELVLTGLEEEYCGIQATVMAGGASFELDQELYDNHPSIYCAYTQDGAYVTVYIIAQLALNSGSSLRLGVLTGVDTPSTAYVSGLKLLTADNLEGAFCESVQIPSGNQETSPGRPPSHTSSGTASTVPSTPSAPSTAVPAAPETPGGGQADVLEGPGSPGTLPFEDVAATSWHFDAVAYVYGSGLMRGLTDTIFAPGGTTTRAQIVTILHRMEGEPAPLAPGDFWDVAERQWYALAVGWAAEEKIVEGYGDNRFGPNDSITREQMAAILYRYARYKGYDTSAEGNLASFADVGSVSGWAVKAMSWAVGSGLITGKGGGTLDPRGTATRAEAAAILTRFCEGIAK